jgi:ATP-dependent helicase HrpA
VRHLHDQIQTLLDSAMLVDQHRLSARLRSLHRHQNNHDQVQALHEAVKRSVDLRARRAALVPTIHYPPDLPVSQRAEEIAQAVVENQVVVVCGDTGSGKTTQLPKVLLSLGLGVAGSIGHTQPRRLAARSVAARIADELQVPLGQQIGSKVRFGDKTSPQTLVKLMTDGILLAEIQSDPRLLAYEALIIDEAHERSLNIDFLLGYLRRLLPRRPDLKIVITSATIDPQRFADHFKDAHAQPAKIIQVEGRTYPVEIRYRPRPEGVEHAESVADTIAELWEQRKGDVLVFEPGEREIRDTARTLERRFATGVEVLPLYARLAHHHQDEIFNPHGRPRIVVSTNVAETSLTVPGIRYVVDGGMARINRYSPRSKVQRLEVEPISQASARQRAGRCGRVTEGICVRLYSEQDHNNREEFTDPEILRSSLAAVILQMRALKLGAVEDFPFIDPPESRRIADGYELLTQLGALDEHKRLTPVGSTLAKLPVDPRLGRVLLTAHELGVMSEALVIVSALSVEDPRERPIEKREAADQAHAEFKSEESDFMVLLNIWRWFENTSDQVGSARLRKACAQRYLSYRKLREWHETHRQIRLMLAASGYRSTTTKAIDEQLYEPLHRALLSGLLDGVGRKLDKKDPKSRQWEYEDQRGQRFAIFPGSALAQSKPRWIVATELVRTTRLYARLCARVQPGWIEDAAGPLLKRAHSDPAWDRAQGKVMARERVSLGALELSTDRRVHLGPADPVMARSIFIEHALMDGALKRKPGWLRDNLNMVSQTLALEHKLRAKGALGVEDAALAWYERTIPAQVYSEARLEKWSKRARTSEQPLRMTQADLLPAQAASVSNEEFPDQHDVFGTMLAIRYTHDPGGTDDGVSVDVQLEDLPAIDADRAAWLVPGRITEITDAMLRQLPKGERRRLDIPTLVRTAHEMPFAVGPLGEAIARHVHKQSGVEIAPGLMDPRQLPDELRLLVRVLDDRGKLIEQSRDVLDLQRRLATVAARSQRELEGGGYPMRGFKAWIFEDPPERVRTGTARDNASTRAREAYPAIIDATEHVDLELRTSRAEALRLTYAGVRRLAALAIKRELKLDPRRLPGFERAAAAYAAMGDAGTLRDEILLATAERCFALHANGVPTTREEFDLRAQRAWSSGASTAQDMVKVAATMLGLRHAMLLALSDRHPSAWEPALNDMRRQLDRLIGPRFLTSTPHAWLNHLERFVRGMEKRLAKLRGGGLARDTRSMGELHTLEQRLGEIIQRGHMPEEAARIGWLLEELRVSLFAQELRTSVPVSVQKLTEAIEAARLA